MKALEIEAPSRIHIALSSMSKNMHRMNGGVGFAINNYDVNLRIEEAKCLTIKRKNNTIVSDYTVSTIHELLTEIYEKLNLKIFARINILQCPKEHSGFGTGTSLRLAIIEGVLILNKCTMRQEEIVKLSKRGGTSGVGVNTYFEGGFIVDAGRKDGLYAPSSKIHNHSLPLKLLRVPMPNWEVMLYETTLSKPLSKAEEIEFFENSCPIAELSVLNNIHDIFHLLLPSVLESELNAFTKAINILQKGEWKFKEWNCHPALVDIYNGLTKTRNSCIGLSSLGPLLYIIGKNKGEVATYLRKKDPIGKLKYVTPNNTGRVIRFV